MVEDLTDHVLVDLTGLALGVGGEEVAWGIMELPKKIMILLGEPMCIEHLPLERPGQLRVELTLRMYLTATRALSFLLS